MAKLTIKLYFDILSPFTYLAFYVLHAVHSGLSGFVAHMLNVEADQEVQTHPVFARCDIVLVPVLLRDILRTCGNSPPLTIKNKDKWMMSEYRRWASYFNVPVAKGFPAGFPVLTVQVQRHLAALSTMAPEKVQVAARALYTHFFVDLKPIVDVKDFMPVLEKALGKELSREISAKAEGIGEQTLKKNTTKALGDGAFGLPWILATNGKGKTEGFWGVDHLGQVLHHLGLDIPRDGSWKASL